MATVLVLPMLVVHATILTVAFGATVVLLSTDSNLTGSDTASVTSAVYTYAGSGTTTYPASTTAPTAVGTLSVTPSVAVDVTPSGHSSNYSPSYVYAPGTLAITQLTLERERCWPGCGGRYVDHSERDGFGPLIGRRICGRECDRHGRDHICGVHGRTD